MHRFIAIQIINTDHSSQIFGISYALLRFPLLFQSAAIFILQPHTQQRIFLEDAPIGEYEVGEASTEYLEKIKGEFSGADEAQEEGVRITLQKFGYAIRFSFIYPPIPPPEELQCCQHSLFPVKKMPSQTIIYLPKFPHIFF